MILLQYGLPKSGSTFLTRLLIEASQIGGRSREALRDRVFVGELSSKRGFWGDKLAGLAIVCSKLREDDLEYLIEKSRNDRILEGYKLDKAG